MQARTASVFLTLLSNIHDNPKKEKRGEAKEALRKFDEACGNRPAAEPKDGSEKSEKKKKSFMDKIKETFED